MEKLCYSDVVVKTLKTFLAPLFSKDINLREIDSNEFENKDFNYAIFISFIGPFEGILLMQIDEDSVHKFVDNIIIPNSSNVSENEIVKGYYGELANILIARLVNKISGDSKGIDITTPSLISGHAMSFQIPYENQCSISLTSEVSDLNIVIYYKKNEDYEAD